MSDGHDETLGRDRPEARAPRSRVRRGLTEAFRQADDTDRLVVDAVRVVAERRSVPRAQVALAWVLQQPAVTAPIIGARGPEQVADAVAATQLTLDEDELRLLEQHSVPHRPTGIA